MGTRNTRQSSSEGDSVPNEYKKRDYLLARQRAVIAGILIPQDRRPASCVTSIRLVVYIRFD
jgi:hypothetical protein